MRAFKVVVFVVVGAVIFACVGCLPLDLGFSCFPAMSPTCMAAVLIALEKVPPKFEKVLVPVTDVSLEQVIKWNTENIEAAQEQGALVLRRIAAPLFYFGDRNRENDNGYVKGKGPHSNRTFFFSCWIEDGEVDLIEDIILKEEMEKDLATENLRPWTESGI